MAARFRIDTATFATLAAAALIANQVAGKALRDGLFLSNYDVTALPLMVMAAAFFSIAVALFTSRAMSTVGPRKFLLGGLLAGTFLLLGEWVLLGYYPRAAAVAVYLHLAALGASLISAFWSMVNERFDPRTAKRTVSRIAAGGTAGGLVGGVLAERVAATFTVSANLPLLAVFHLINILGDIDFCRTGLRTRRQGRI